MSTVKTDKIKLMKLGPVIGVSSKKRKPDESQPGLPLSSP